MKNLNNLNIVIPAIENNQYGPKGDLADFGDVSLFEWKLNQILEVTTPEKVFISTSSEKIEKISASYNVNIIRRSPDKTLSEVETETIEKLPENHVLWTHVTYPFISPETYKKSIQAYFEKPNECDSLISVLPIKEFFLYNKKPLNFEWENKKSRQDLEPVYKLTNGIMITSKETALQNKRLSGNTPHLFEFDELSSTEINDETSFKQAMSLISEYFNNHIHMLKKENQLQP